MTIEKEIIAKCVNIESYLHGEIDKDKTFLEDL